VGRYGEVKVLGGAVAPVSAVPSARAEQPTGAESPSATWVAVYEPVREELDLVAARVIALAAAGAFPLGEAAGALARSPGKLMRPALILLAGLTGPPVPSLRAARRRARLIAVASGFELLHLASLAHDDILDASPLRRGAPSVWGRWGTEIAILTGDHLYGKALAEVSLAGRRAMNSLCRAIDGLLAGEALELRAGATVAGRRGYMALATAKTAVFCAESLAVGASVAGAGRAVIAGLKSYGRALGQAYQLTDDLLDFRGDPAEMGKPCLGDLSRGRFTFPIIVGLTRRPGRVGRIIEGIRRAEAGADNLPRLLRRELEACGAFEETARYARRKIDRAIAGLAVLPPGAPRDNLAVLAENLVGRRA